MKYPDTVTFVETTVDEYGTVLTGDEYEVKAIFEQSIGWSHGDNQSAITSDAICRPDPSNSFIQDNFYRLEEYILVAEKFGSPASRSWFKVENVATYQDTQLCNTLDNIQLNLKKVSAPNVS